MDREEIEARAWTLLEAADDVRVPVDVIRACQHQGIAVMEATFPDDTSGMVRREDRGPVIYVNRAHPTTRKRFTVAHELGHVLLGHLVEEPALTDRDADLYLFRATAGAHDVREVEANRFAGALLMPARLVLGEADRIGGTLDARLLAERFWVSEAAMAVRLRDLLPQTALGR